MKQKTLIQLFLFFSLFFSNKLFACLNVSYTTTQVGNTVTFAASVPVGYVINTYYWTFGDGNNSTSPNPTHTYANGGGYNACMVISGIDNNNNIFQCSYCDSLYIPNNVTCNASYTFTTTGNTANFNSTATGPGVITNYAWNFGDGNQSNLQNPSHTYANSGTYNVCHTIYGIDNGITYTCNWCDSVTVNVNNQPCNASFIYTISGNLVAFTNTATGPGAITNYAWNFGDGNQSNLANPTHTYATTGWYYVCLTIYGIDNGITYTCNWCDSIYVQVPGGNPCNGVNYTSTQVGNQVSFSPSLPVGYVVNTNYWTFGDGGTSNVANPTHTYANNGSYTACMVVSGTTPNNGFFQCTWCDSILIGMNVPCNASFISTTSGNTVAFTNTATGPGMITGYAWTFGDGGTSTAPNPTHTYANNGSYNVCLTITGIDNNITYTCTWCDSVTVGNNINPCNNITYTTTQVGNAVTFAMNAPVGYNFSSYAWTFGDGGTSNVANPTHTYATAGWYYACVTVSGYVSGVNLQFTCTYCDSIFIPNNAPCNASFTSTTSGNTVAFTNTATGPGMITGYAWTFGDGGTSTAPNPTHTYANNGTYNVCLTITGIDNNITYTCTWCDSVTVGNNINPCNNISYMTTQIGNAVTFNAVVPVGFVPTTYYWTFGDGGTSNVAIPTHTYLNNGWYNACLVISGIYNNTMITCTWCDSLYVGNNIQPCAATFTTSISGNTATFTNTATGPGMITGYAWTFGDGGTSTSPNPSHTYANSGWYNVCLTITGIDNGATYSCTWCDSINIQMGGNPCNGVYFTPSQTGNIFTFAAVTPPGYTINTYYWTFGDGGTSNIANPTHTYANNGWYNVCMVISGVANNTPFQCSICDSVYVIASGLQDVNYNNVLHVYPNPANNFIQIDIPSKEHYVLKLYDVAGKLLDERKIIEATDQYTYTTDRLSKGMYFIQLTGDTKKYQTNFIKQ
ncbi:MAG: PKD domain-containing protein [Bacteroidetes bacterium]|nr:PKD domain-containing protein [Bacteroidota bacterium]